MIRDVEKLKEDYRIAKVELEQAQRQLRKIKENSTIIPQAPIQAGSAITIPRSPSQRIMEPNFPSSTMSKPKKYVTSRDGDPDLIGSIQSSSSSSSSTHTAPAQPTLVIPPKFIATKWQSMTPDGCGGQKRAFSIPYAKVRR